MIKACNSDLRIIPIRHNMKDMIQRNSRLSSFMRLTPEFTRASQRSPRLYHRGQYVQPQSYLPQSSPPPSYFNNEIPWSHQSRWIRWPAYLCAVGIAGWWSWAVWHIEKAPFTNRRRLMFFSHNDMANIQRHNEYSASSMLGIFPANMNAYFATAKHVLNDQEEEKIAPVFRKLLKVAREEKYGGKEELFFCHHLIEAQTNYFGHDHSMWPGRIFMTSIGLEIVAFDQVGLATIMSHQFAHTYLNHAGEEMSFELFQQRACYPVPILVLLGIASKQIRIPTAAYCLCAGLMDWYGRQWFPSIIENEADVWGLEVMKKAGFDVTKATQYWERKTKYIQAMIDKAKTLRESSDAHRRTLLDHYLKESRERIKTNNEHIATIQKYVKDNDILPLPVENPTTTDSPPEPLEPEDQTGSDVPNAKE